MTERRTDHSSDEGAPAEQVRTAARRTALTSTIRFSITLPARTIAPVLMRLRTSFCAVPAFRRVEPVRTSGPVSRRMG